MDEQWETIPTWEAYEASSLGRIRAATTRSNGRWKAGHVLKPQINNSGYACVVLYVGCPKPTIQTVHRLVALAFLGTPDGLEINHIDGNKINNIPANLEYVTRGDNHRHAFALGLKKPIPSKGEANGRARLSLQDVQKIRDLLGNGRSQIDLARCFGVSRSTISAVATRRNWPCT